MTGLERDTGSRLRRRARVTKWVFYAVAVLAAVGLVVLALDEGALRAMLTRGLSPEQPITLTLSAKVAVWAAAAVPSAVFIWVMIRLAGMFKRIETGHVMIAENARALSDVGRWLIAFAVLSVVARTVQVLAATLANDPGQRALSIGIGMAELGAIAAGAAFLAFGLVMQEAVRLAEDSESIV